MEEEVDEWKGWRRGWQKEQWVVDEWRGRWFSNIEVEEGWK